MEKRNELHETISTPKVALEVPLSDMQKVPKPMVIVELATVDGSAIVLEYVRVVSTRDEPVVSYRSGVPSDVFIRRLALQGRVEELLSRGVNFCRVFCDTPLQNLDETLRQALTKQWP